MLAHYRLRITQSMNKSIGQEQTEYNKQRKTIRTISDTIGLGSRHATADARPTVQHSVATQSAPTSGRVVASSLCALLRIAQTPRQMLNLCHLRCGPAAILVVLAHVGATAVVHVVLVVAVRIDRRPVVEKLGPKQFRERHAELSTHRAVQDEIDGRIQQCQQVQEVAYSVSGNGGKTTDSQYNDT